MIQAIIFDFDGLILDTECPEYLSWHEIYESFGLDLPIAAWVEFIGRGVSTIATTPYDDLEQKLDHPIDRAEIRSRRRARFAELMRTETMLPGVQSLIEEANASGIRLAVASSSPRTWVCGYLEKLGIAHYFEVVKCCDDVPLAKPEPDLYLAALAALGLQANQAVALEDSVNGVAAAKAAGLFCIAVPNLLTRSTAFDRADRVIESLVWVTADTLSQMVHD